MWGEVMIEKRAFPRFRFEARCVLKHDNRSYDGQMVNISLDGAMISFNESTMVPQDEKCSLVIFMDSVDIPEQIEVVAVYSSLSFIGVKFIGFDEITYPQLYGQIEILSKKPEKYKVMFH